MKEVDRYSLPSIPKLVVAKKCDLKDKFQVNQVIQNKLSEEFNLKSIETSAKKTKILMNLSF